MFDLKGHVRLNKALYVYSFSSNNSSVKPTLPLMLPQIACALLSPIPTERERDVSFFYSLDAEIILKKVELPGPQHCFKCAGCWAKQQQKVRD